MALRLGVGVGKRLMYRPSDGIIKLTMAFKENTSVWFEVLLHYYQELDTMSMEVKLMRISKLTWNNIGFLPPKPLPAPATLMDPAVLSVTSGDRMRVIAKLGKFGLLDFSGLSNALVSSGRWIQLLQEGIKLLNVDILEDYYAFY